MPPPPAQDPIDRIGRANRTNDCVLDAVDPRVAKGAAFAEMLWWSLAKRIIKIAGEHYGWKDEQWTAASELFLRPNYYKITIL